tara:strand:+ start:2301 stop:2495 length:195 start_codon:yes stop_codon:yes gene_type:complete
MTNFSSNSKKPIFNVWSFIFSNGFQNREAKLPIDIHKSKSEAITEFTNLVKVNVVFEATIIGRV